ncbi:MAG: hypothetical protein V8S14_06750 [Lachnospiraceae bacterium]
MDYVSLPVSSVTMILNVVLLVIVFLTCVEIGAKTVYTSIPLPLYLHSLTQFFRIFSLCTR